MPSLVFDIGGTHLRAAVARPGGGLEARAKRRIDSIAGGHSPEHIWDGLLASIETYASAQSAMLAASDPIAISFPGPVGGAGEILAAPTLTGSETTLPDIRGLLERRTGRPVFLLNDLSAAAWHLSTKVSGRFFVVTVSSGIGSKIFDPHLGAFDDLPFGGEIGHSIVDPAPGAVRCDCGGRGHLGAIASGRGIERAARAMALSDSAGFAQSRCVTVHGASAATLSNEQHIVPALRDGDLWTQAIVRACTRPLASVLVQIVLAAAIERVFVIGGFARNGGDAYIRVLREAASLACDYALLRPSIAERIQLEDIEEDSALLGAAAFAASRIAS